jgi:hypothetical protein
LDDLNAMLSSVLSDPDKVRQIQEMAASLGFGAPEEPAPPPPPPPPPPAQTPDLSALSAMLQAALGQNQPTPPQSNTPDLSALMGMLGGNSATQSQTGTPDLSALMGMLGGNSATQSQTGTPDLSALAGMLGNAMGGQTGQPQQAQSPSGAGFDVAALTNMLGGVPSGGGNAPGLPIDMNTIMKLGQAMSSMQGNRQNVDFLLSLKPRLNERRAKKIDDAIKVMQLIQFLPLIKETGLFSGLDDLLGGLGGSGGLGSILGNMGIGSGGRGGLLGGLLGL